MAKDGPKVESKSGGLPRADLDSLRGKSLMNMFSGAAASSAC